MLNHDRDARRVLVVPPREVAPCDECDAHRVEIVFVDAGRQRFRGLLARWKLKSFGRDRHTADRVVQHRDRRRHRHGLDARQRSGPFRDVLKELLRLRVGVTNEVRVEPHHHEVIGPIAGADDELLAEAAIHEHRDDQQHDGDRHLPARENRSAPAPPASGRDRVARLHDRREIRA